MVQGHFLIPASAYESYEAYLGATGENAVLKSRNLSPEQVLTEIERSGLRGRGGAGFPTGEKWRSLFSHPCGERSIVCNAAEGEPGTFKDRFLLRKNPYAPLEGMLIAAHVLGTKKLYIGIKASFSQEIARLERALSELEEQGLLADCEITVVQGPEEYLFGEEKALLNVIEGIEPLPREAHEPPYERGLFATPASPNPALVNNVETYAHVPGILRHGSESFRSLGSDDTPGTLLCTVSGAVNRPGVYEIQGGVPLRYLFEEIAGGPILGRRFKAALSGVSTGVIAAENFDTPTDFESLEQIGSGLGSAGFIVIDDSESMVRVTQTVARFLYVESCNQCPACKHGLFLASSALDNLLEDEGSAAAEVLEQVINGARRAPQGNRCFLPVQGSVLLPSLIDRFSDEFLDPRMSDGKTPLPWLIPKLIDYDEESETFAYDALQPLKNEDWTYSVPKAPETARPSAAAAKSIRIRLAPDIWESLVDLTHETGKDLEMLVDEGLREWIRKAEKSRT